jgi:predicted porin
MNKKLIALAVVGACVAPEAMAQTANPVTLYGRIYATFESVEAKGGAAPVSRRNRVADQASYLGVRGTEDLGGGLKAFFQLETGFPPDNTGTFANRNSAIGLQGGFGSILLGRWDTPMKVTQTAVDPWGDLTNGDITGAALDQGNFSNRFNNSVQYWSPTFAGFAIRAMYVANETKSATANPQSYGGSLTWSSGPIYLAYAYEKHKDVASVGTTNLSEEGNAIAASFKFGDAKFSGQYGEYKRDGSGATKETKDKSYMVGLEWAFGKNVLLASWQHAEVDNTNAECDMGSIGYRYDFTRRTFFIASYTKVENDNGMNCNFGTNALGAAGQNPEGVGLGIRHLF